VYLHLSVSNQEQGAQHLASYWCLTLLEKKNKMHFLVCPQDATMYRDAVITEIAGSELSLCTRNNLTMFILLGLIIGLKSLFEGKT